MRESLTLTTKEQQRTEVASRWLAGIPTTDEAVLLLGCGERTAWLRAAMVGEGAVPGRRRTRKPIVILGCTMDAADDRAARLYPDWPRYAARLVDALAGLTAEQLSLRAAPEHPPIWALASHVAGARAYWLCGVFGEPGADTTPFVDPLGDGWEDDESHPRTAAELAWALNSTWTLVAGCLERWKVASLGQTAERRLGDRVQVHSRASVLNRLLAHDAYHAGEISQILGVAGLPAADPWSRPAP